MAEDITEPIATSKNLGNVMAVVRSMNPPLESDNTTEKRYVIWAQRIGVTQNYLLRYYENQVAAWIPFGFTAIIDDRTDPEFIVDDKTFSKTKIMELINSVYDQDNIFKNKRFDYDGGRSRTALAGLINASATFTIGQKDLYIFSTYNSGVAPGVEVVYTFIIIGKGKGTYGTGGTQTVAATNILILSEYRAPVLDNPRTQEIDLGEIGASDIWTILNAKPAMVIQDQNDGYVIVKSMISGVAQQHFFIGVGGNYGVGGTAAVEADFFGPVGDTDFIPNFVPYTEWTFEGKGWGNTLPVYQAGDVFKGWNSATKRTIFGTWNGTNPKVAANMDSIFAQGE